ncbi:helix-turn-helix transcriptional regulator [Haloterrigena sp. SYSU A558-1]|uniref:Helix-turn-helix transcriptional regulator n=1 Tax=Haloterrigena gelatinilytica TaxID=2741724 RepID=A0ABX2LBM2_9EURY|nr:helix-turn-helix domain-containing protein [Haloterrigena gelatinilytica]NUC73675.1 helix-turn-helix transcriptional regulator [Haloterrigena gelatinilytica]
MTTQPPGDETEEKTDAEQQNSDLCNVVGAVEEIGTEWKLITLHNLRDGEMRFNELKRSTGASSYTLSRVLDDLEEKGFVENRKELESPVASYYTLTEKGANLSPVFEALDDWGAEWLE